MVVKDGKKYACESCIRGHRVSGCHHTDRELHFIAPKGRPVKQCDHCRGARKAKSHHAKCDCGGRLERNEVKLDDKGCCCALGDNCVCGTKTGVDLRVDTSRPIHGRPHLTKGTSDGHITTYINGHNKAVHKWEKGDQNGAPYPCRTKTLNGSSGHCNAPSSMGSQQQPSQAIRMPHRGSKDDTALQSPQSGMYSGTFSQLSVDNLPLTTFSAGTLFANPNYTDSSQQQLLGLTSPGSQDDVQFSPNESSPEALMTDIFGTSNTSPVNSRAPTFPSAPESFQASTEDLSFMAADLPLNAGYASSVMAPRAISNSDESLLHSGPGLTAGSSGTPSEMGDFNAASGTGIDNNFDLGDVLATPAEIQGFSFDAASLSSNQKMEQMTVKAPESNGQIFTFDGMSLAPDSKMQQMPTSGPASTGRRSLDVASIRKLSAYPDFGDAFVSFLDQSSMTSNGNVGTADLASSFPVSTSIPLDTQNVFASNRAAVSQPNAFIAPTSDPGSNGAVDAMSISSRPRSVTLPFDLSNYDYDPNITVNNMYPQLDQDFTNAAAWDPTGLDLGTTNWLFQPQ